MLSNEELLEMKDTLSQEIIDDAEEILDWFGEHGVNLIDELLEYRKSIKVEVDHKFRLGG